MATREEMLAAALRNNPGALDEYWANNPGALEAAMAANPGAFERAAQADEYVAGLTDAQRFNTQLSGANLATYDERSAVSDAIRRYRADNEPAGPASNAGNLRDGGGTWDGTFADGSRTTDPGAGSNEIAPPDWASDPLPGGTGIQDWTAPGVNDWDGQNVTTDALNDPNTVPPTEETAPDWLAERDDLPAEWDFGQRIEYTPPSDTPGSGEWDWGRFGTQTDTGGFGPYFPNYDASLRFSPGEGATWGSDKFPGDNRDFYQNQFGNLLRQTQGYQAANRAAAIRRQQAAENPAESMPLDWSWVEGGLPEVEIMESGYASPLAGLDTSGSGYQQGGAALFYDPVQQAWTTRIPQGAPGEMQGAGNPAGRPD